MAARAKGAQARAIHYSLIATAQANGHHLYHYLRYVYKEMPNAKTVEEIERFDRGILMWRAYARRNAIC